jgi:cysteine-S-conjugate beta-lyase
MEAVMFDFSEVIPRTGSGSLKWDYAERFLGVGDLIPMWVADMDFRSPREISAALHAAVDHGMFGYTGRGDDFNDALVQWLARHHDWRIDPEWIVFSPGIVTGISFAIRSLTEPGDRILMQPPVYYPFFETTQSSGREVVWNPLRYENGRFSIDFDDFQRKLQGTKMFLLCSPHNPSGRVWPEPDLRKMLELCRDHGVLVVSDEIHHDLTYPGVKHIAAGTIALDNLITFVAPSKTFNLAGFATAAAIIPDPDLRRRFSTLIVDCGLQIGNRLGVFAWIAAYRHGEPWRAALMEYLAENLRVTDELLRSEAPKIRLVMPEATFIPLLDCRGMGLDDTALRRFFLQEAKVGLDPGTFFGPGGEGFMRINIATPRSILNNALERIAQAYRNQFTR